MILVMAAHGNQGKLLLPKLRDAGFKIRAFRATPGRENELKALGATEVIAGDATDRNLLRKVLDGVETVYHIGPTTHPQELEMGLAMVSAAAETNVGHFIYSSVLHAIASKMPQHKLKRDVEERIIESGLNFTILQPADYMMPNALPPAFDTGVFDWLYGPDQLQAMVDLYDFADVVVKVAREREKHFGATYELCAGNYSGNDIAATIASVIGKPVDVRVLKADKWFADFYGGGSGPGYKYQSAVIRAVALWYDQYTFAGNSNVLTWLLGHPPTTFEQFIQREWAAFKNRDR